MNGSRISFKDVTPIYSDIALSKFMKLNDKLAYIRDETKVIASVNNNILNVFIADDGMTAYESLSRHSQTGKNGYRCTIELPELKIEEREAKLLKSYEFSREVGKLEVYLLIECKKTKKLYVRKDLVELHEDPRFDIEFTLPSRKKSARK